MNNNLIPGVALRAVLFTLRAVLFKGAGNFVGIAGSLLVPVGNLHSEILVVQSAQNWHRQRPTDSLDDTRDRRVLVQR
jgi:hypothetical protein